MANVHPSATVTMAHPSQRTRQRSPNYPAIGLKAAIDKARQLYEADRKAGAPIDAALKHMGFSKRHGQAMAVLSALKKFNLVEESSGRIVLTQQAIDILVFPEQDERRVRAIRECALSPDIYRELFDQYKSSGMPSDETLRAELIADKHFNPSAVEGFIRDFKETLIFAGIMDSVELSLGHEDSLEMADSTAAVQQGTASTPAPGRQPPISTTKLQIQEFIVPLSGNGRAVFQWPTTLSKEDIDDLKDSLKILERKISRPARIKAWELGRKIITCTACSWSAPMIGEDISSRDEEFNNHVCAEYPSLKRPQL